MFARRVVYPVSAGDRPIENMFQPLPGAAGGDWRRDHKRLQDLEDVGGGDFGDLPATERSGGMVKAGNPLCGVFVVAPSGTAQLNHFIGSFPERGYAANPPSVCLSRPLVFQNVPTQVFKGDVRLSGESRNLRHPPTATPSKVRAATKPVPKITQIKRITVQDQAPPTSHHITPPPVFPPKAGTHAPPTATTSKVRAATKPIPKITQIKRITVQDHAPPHRNPLEGPDGNQTSPKNHPNQTNHSSRPSAPHQPPHHHPTRLSAESRNPRPLPTFRIPTSRRRRHAPHPSFRRKPESTSPPNRNPLEGPGGNQTSPKNHSNQTNHSSRPSAPHQPPHNHPHPSFRRTRNPIPHSALPIPNSP